MKNLFNNNLINAQSIIHLKNKTLYQFCNKNKDKNKNLIVQTIF